VVSSHPNSEGEGDVLLVSDEATVRNEVSSVVEGLGFGVHELALGAGVTPAVQRHPYRLAILDLQIGNMGGMATCMDLRLEESGGRLPHVPVLMLLDRRADVFLARRSGAEGWVVKPLDPIRLRKAVKAVLAGAAYHDRSFQPAPSTPAANI
jgi:DNA-binding response OmpR family regulator